MISLSQQNAVKKYNKAHYDIITAYLPKGYKERIKGAAQSMNISATAFVKAAIDEKLQTMMYSPEAEQEQKQPEKVQ